MKCQVDAIQWGGVVAEFFRGLKSRRDSVGGGSTRNFPLMGPFYQEFFVNGALFPGNFH